MLNRLYSFICLLVEMVVVQSISHSCGDGAHSRTLRNHSELHEEDAGAHRATVLVGPAAIAHGCKATSYTW